MIKFLILFLLSTSVLSENYVHLGMWSQHPEKGLNETHNLVGIEIDGYFIHKFENSIKQTAYYAGVIEREGYCIDKLCLGYSYGALQGYSFKELTPIAYAVISYEKYGIGADISCLPGTVCAIQFRFSDKVFEYLDVDSPWNAKGYMELSLDHFDPDGEGELGFERNNGASYDIKLYLTDDVFIKGNYTQTDFGAQPDQGDEKFTPVWQTQTPSQVSSTGYIEVGKDFGSFTVSTSFNQISIQENTLNRNTGKLTQTPNKHHRGFGVHVGTNYQLTENVTLELEAAIVDRVVRDLKLTVGTTYKLTDNLDLTVRTIDWERWNMTQYQVGLRYRL